MDLSIILSVIGIISPFILATVWMTTLITKTSNRALLLETKADDHGKKIADLKQTDNRVLLLEMKIEDHNKRVNDLELATSYSSIEKVVEKICRQVFNSREFKDSMKEPIETAVEKSVRNTLLHIEKNKSIAQGSAFDEILDEIRRIHIDLTHNKV